jgi:hypothetical protein
LGRHSFVFFLVGTVPSESRLVAFHAKLAENHVFTLEHNNSIVFNEVPFNSGTGYNRDSGMFVCPVTGLYGFSWTVVVGPRDYEFTEFMVNGEVYGESYAGVEQMSTTGDSGTGKIILLLNHWDHAWVRTGERGGGHIASNRLSTCSGWLIH